MKILYLQYVNPAAYPPLEHSSHILAGMGWRVRFLGIGAFAEADQLAFPPHVNIRVTRLGYCAPGWRQKLHYGAFCVWALGWVLVWRPQWVYVSDPLACPAAFLVSWIPGIRLIYHEHDSPAEGTAAGRFQQLVMSARTRLAARAVCCVLPNGVRAERFERNVRPHRKVQCVWNCPSRQEVAPARPVPDGEMWVVYQGSLSPARLPEAVLEALSRLPPEVKLRVIGYETIGNPSFLENLQAAARRWGVASRLEIGGAASRDHLMRVCQTCDVGLSLFPTRSSDVNENAMPGASNKVFEYLACGLPLLVPDLPDWKALYVEPGYALSCVPEEPASIADALRWFWENRGCARRMGERGQARIAAEWNYEKQFQPVLDILEGRTPQAAAAA